MIYVILFVIVAILYYFSGNIIEYFFHNNKNDEKEKNYFEGKLNKTILTKNELNFYNQLKLVTDKYNLIIFCKMRVADLISTNNISEFNKIKSKHIDFTICNKETNPLLFIELDDSTHNNYRNKQNDIKKDNIFYSIGYTIIRLKVKEHYEFDEIENRLSMQFVDR